MSAEIIDFIPKALENVSINPTEYGYVGSERVKKPNTAEEYLVLLKRFLETCDYEETLLCILDEEYYDTADKPIQKIVDCYYSFFD